MKWESDELEGKPENVFIGKWLPQDDILAHPNMKAFISHCGLGSVAEAKYHGVPVVGMPIGIDQKTNIDSITAEGWAEKVDFANLNEIELLETVRKVVENPKYFFKWRLVNLNTNLFDYFRYGEKAKSISQLYRDRPTNARETATFWVEYVIRHRGAPHLRYPGADQNFFQSKSIDVVLFLVAVLFIFVKVLVALFKFLASKLCKSNKKSKKVKKN